MTIFPQWERCECNKEFLQPTEETPIKPSLLIVMNAKENEIIYVIYDHASLSTCCFTHW